jgi:transposase
MMERRKVMTMPPIVVPGQRQARQMARQEIVRQMELGATVAEAQRRCSVPMHRTTVYRLLKRVQSEGEQVLAERRHGHPVKLRGEALTFLKDHCQRAPSRGFLHNPRNGALGFN